MAEKVFDMLRVGDNLYHGGPTGFAKMRKALALAAGIPLTHIDIVVENGEEVRLEVPDLTQFDLVLENIYGEWETPPPDPILYLLAHSDESGEIKREHMVELVYRIMALTDDAAGIILERDGEEEAKYIRDRLVWFSNHLAMAYDTNRPVEFKLEPYYP